MQYHEITLPQTAARFFVEELDRGGALYRATAKHLRSRKAQIRGLVPVGVDATRAATLTQAIVVERPAIPSIATPQRTWPDIKLYARELILRHLVARSDNACVMHHVAARPDSEFLSELNPRVIARGQEVYLVSMVTCNMSTEEVEHEVDQILTEALECLYSISALLIDGVTESHLGLLGSETAELRDVASAVTHVIANVYDWEGYAVWHVA